MLYPLNTPPVALATAATILAAAASMSANQERFAAPGFTGGEYVA